jgi:4-alpha-glucanotransferase
MDILPLTQRASGILLHPTSLPSGQLDADVFRWLDFLADSCQQVWQVLPLGIPAIGNSPYQCLSAFAANPDLLPHQLNLPLDADESLFIEWKEQQSYWLHDFALFTVLKDMNNNVPWYEWPKPMRDRNPETLAELSEKYSEILELFKWQQFLIHKTWNNIVQAAHDRKIHLFGDMPIFVAHDSADVWAHRGLFMLDKDGQPEWVTGVPPDYFSETGQRWGNPQYNWQAMQETGFSWWLQRLLHHFQWFDLVRIDHFRGLEAVWMIDAKCDTAIDGYWEKTPGDQMLQLLQEKMGSIPLVAEDLGVITPEVTRLRKKFKLPGMSVLQFAFDAFEDNPHKPANITLDRIVYSGTHDNNTSVGWFSALKPDEQQFVRDTLEIDDDKDIVDAVIESALESQAILSMFPLQDILKLGEQARMNIPGDDSDHWLWKFSWDQLTPDISAKLKDMTIHANRC